jgi:hypothetical protein
VRTRPLFVIWLDVRTVSLWLQHPDISVGIGYRVKEAVIYGIFVMP